MYVDTGNCSICSAQKERNSSFCKHIAAAQDFTDLSDKVSSAQLGVALTRLLQYPSKEAKHVACCEEVAGKRAADEAHTSPKVEDLKQAASVQVLYEITKAIVTVIVTLLGSSLRLTQLREMHFCMCTQAHDFPMHSHVSGHG